MKEPRQRNQRPKDNVVGKETVPQQVRHTICHMSNIIQNRVSVAWKNLRKMYLFSRLGNFVIVKGLESQGI